jgi:hypothetical protein
MHTFIKKLLKLRISPKLILAIFPLMLIQLILPIRSLALYLIEDLGVPFIVLELFEIITVPLTILILLIAIINHLKWPWLGSKQFAIGFASPILFILALMIFALAGIEFPALYFLDTFYEYIYALFDPIASPVVSMYKGWDTWTSLTLTAALAFCVLFPIFTGVLTNIIYFLYSKFKK